MDQFGDKVVNLGSDQIDELARAAIAYLKNGDTFASGNDSLEKRILRSYYRLSIECVSGIRNRVRARMHELGV